MGWHLLKLLATINVQRGDCKVTLITTYTGLALDNLNDALSLLMT